MSDTGKALENNEKNAGFTTAPAVTKQPPAPPSLVRTFAKAVGHMALGAGLSMLFKTGICALSLAGAPTTLGIVAIAATTSMAVNLTRQLMSSESQKVSFKKLMFSGAFGALGSGLLLAFGDEITDTLCSFLKGNEAAPVVMEDTSVAPAIEPSAGGINTIEPPMSAQDMKDEAFMLFNDGDAANDLRAVDLFNKAAELGNYGARIDQAYIEHWGLAGTDMDKAESIEKMKDVLADMKEAGRNGTAEYNRGQDLLNKWLGLNDTPPATVEADSVQETTESDDIHDHPEGKEKAGEEADGKILYEQNDQTGEDTAAPSEPESAEETSSQPAGNDDGMVEREIRLSPAEGSVGCEDGWVTLDPKGQMFLSCPLNGNADMSLTPGTIMNVTPPATAAPLLSR